MPSEQEMMSDLAAADKAGDKELAQHIASQIKASRTPAPETKPPQPETAGGQAERAVKAAQPWFLKGPAEAGASSASAMLGAPLGSAADIGMAGTQAVKNLFTGRPDADILNQGWGDKIRSMIKPPETKTGKALMKPLEAVAYPFEKGAEKFQEKTMPESKDIGTGKGYAQESLARGGGEFIRQILPMLSAKVAGGALEKLPGKQAALDVTKGEQSMKDDVRAAAQSAGYKTPPEFGVKAGAAGLANKARIEKILSGKNTETATRNLGREVGVPEGRALNAEEFDRLKKDTGKSYDAMKKAVGPEIQVTPRFAGAIKQTLREVSQQIESSPETNKGMIPAQRILREWARKTEPQGPPPVKERMPIERTIDKAVIEQPNLPIARTIEQASSDMPHHYGQLSAPPSAPARNLPARMSTDVAVRSIQKLRQQAKDDYRLGRTDEGDARMAVSDALEKMFEDNLAMKGNASALQDFRTARTRFAKIYLLEDIVNDATGQVDLHKLASLSERPKYKGVLTGEFKTAADFAKTFTKAAQKPTGEAKPRLTVLDGLIAAGAIGSGHPGAMMAAGTELAGRLGIPAMGERGMLQNRTPSYRANAPGAPLGMAGIAAGADEQR